MTYNEAMDLCIQYAKEHGTDSFIDTIAAMEEDENLSRTHQEALEVVIAYGEE